MRLAIAILCLGLTSCSTPAPKTGPNVRDLMSNSAEHLDREVTARGYLQFTPSRRGLSNYPELTLEEVGDLRVDCITVWGYDNAQVDRLSSLNNHLVEIVGRFRHIPVKEDEINLWECNDYGVVIARVVHLGSPTS
jgi:hypothetical protein